MDTDAKKVIAEDLTEQIAAIAANLAQFEQTMQRQNFEGFDLDLLQQIANHADTACATAMGIHELATKAVSRNFCAKVEETEDPTTKIKSYRSDLLM